MFPDESAGVSHRADGDDVPESKTVSLGVRCGVEIDFAVSVFFVQQLDAHKNQSVTQIEGVEHFRKSDGGVGVQHVRFRRESADVFSCFTQELAVDIGNSGDEDCLCQEVVSDAFL